jgi:hypothetical protein
VFNDLNLHCQDEFAVRYIQYKDCKLRGYNKAEVILLFYLDFLFHPLLASEKNLADLDPKTNY